MITSLKKNFIYSCILTVSTYLFPLVVYPYVSRTLGLSNIGIVNFVDNIINYFVLISMMGITTVGVREIAAARNDRRQLSRTYMSLLSLTAVTTLIAVAALWIAMYVVPALAPYRDLLYVGLVKLSFNLFLIEWFFMGMEDFRYITNRSILVKCLYVLCVFLFVRDASDYKIYYVISVAMVVVNAAVNIVYSRRFVDYTFRSVSVRPFCRTFIVMGVYALLINAYSSLNVVWLGFVSGTDEVGYFTTATKLHTIIMAVLASFTNILFPRVSNLLSQGREDEFWHKINLSFDAVFLFAFPTVIYIMIAGPQLLHLIVGDGFEGAYLPLRIITPLVLVIGIEQIIVIQILMARHHDNVVLRNSLIGAIAAISLNLVLMSVLRAPHSAAVWVAAECIILCLSLTDVYRTYKYAMPYRRLLAYCAAYSPLLVVSLLVYDNLDNGYAILVSVAVLVVLYAFLIEVFVLKNKVALQFLESIHLRKQ